VECCWQQQTHDGQGKHDTAHLGCGIVVNLTNISIMIVDKTFSQSLPALGTSSLPRETPCPE
jgi:hypothetical protein